MLVTALWQVHKLAEEGGGPHIPPYVPYLRHLALCLHTLSSARSPKPGLLQCVSKCRRGRRTAAATTCRAGALCAGPAPCPTDCCQQQRKKARQVCIASSARLGRPLRAAILKQCNLKAGLREASTQQEKQYSEHNRGSIGCKRDIIAALLYTRAQLAVRSMLGI
jgi:hypothetical protein